MMRRGVDCEATNELRMAPAGLGTKNFLNLCEDRPMSYLRRSLAVCAGVSARLRSHVRVRAYAQDQRCWRRVGASLSGLATEAA